MKTGNRIGIEFELVGQSRNLIDLIIHVPLAPVTTPQDHMPPTSYNLLFRVQYIYEPTR